MPQKSMPGPERIIAWILLACSPIFVSGGEVVEVVPKRAELERPEENLEFLRAHAPVVSVLLVDEHHGETLISYSLNPKPESNRVWVLRRSESEGVHERTIDRAQCPDLNRHLERLPDIRVPLAIDEQLYKPTSVISVWISGLWGEKFVTFKAPPEKSDDFSYWGTGKPKDEELWRWVQDLRIYVGKQDCSVKVSGQPAAPGKE